MPVPRPLASLWTIAAAKPVAILASVALIGVAAAAITLTYTTTSTVSTSVTPPPIQFLAGTDGVNGTYITGYTLSTNKTYLSTTVLGVPEATIVVDSFFRLTNVDSASHTATLTTSQLSNGYITTYSIQLLDGGSNPTLDINAASPSAAVTIPAGTTYHAKLTLTLGSGAGINNAAVSKSLTLAVT